MCCARGWGTKGSGLGLGRVVSADDCGEEGEYETCAGEVRYPCYVRGEHDHDGGTLVEVHYSREDMLEILTDHPVGTSVGTEHGRGIQKEKRRRIEDNGCTRRGNQRIKSTANIYRECLARIDAQLRDN